VARVAAILVNWNGGQLAVEAASSVVGQTVSPELWVIDNGSTDGSLEAIRRACPGAHVIANAANRGYAAASNQALKLAGDADYVLLVNNDVVLPEPGGLQRVVESLAARPDVNGVCGRYEYPDGRFQHYYNNLPTARDLAVNWGIGRHVRPLLRSRAQRRYYAEDRDYTSEMTLEQPAFSCVLLRGAAVRQVGLMDERLPIFFNDVDYCWRWRQQGWTWHYLPWWRVVHHKSSSTNRLGGLLGAELAGSVVRFARTHYSGPTALFVRLAVVLEAGWRKLVHKDLPVALTDIWRGRLFFCSTDPAG